MDRVILATTLVIFAVLCWMCYRAGNKPKLFDITFSLAIVAAVLVAYHLYTHDLTVLLLPIVVVFNRLAGAVKRRPSLLFTGATACFVLIAPCLGMNTRINFLSILFFFAALSWHLHQELEKGDSSISEASDERERTIRANAIDM